MIIVLRALGLGDLLTATPALRGLARAYPRQMRVMYAPASLSTLAKQIDPGLEVRDAPGLRPLSGSIAGAHCAVNLHGRGPQSHRLLMALAPRARQVGFRNRQVAGSVEGPRWREQEHDRARWCRLLASHGIEADPADIDIHVAAGELPAGIGGATVVHPGAASQARRWPAGRWAEVARAERERGRRVLVTGSPSERHLARAVAELAGLPPSSAIAGLTSLAELGMIVAAAGRVLCGDTGVAHLATALRTPSVVLFGPVSPARWGPPADRPWHVSLWAGREGDPHGSCPDPGLLEITVERVLGAVAGLPSSAPEAGGVGTRRRTVPVAGPRHPADQHRSSHRRARKISPPRPEPLNIALLAPPWIAVPPPGYGGIEAVVAEVASALVRRGHRVTLLAPPGSRSTARVVPLLERHHPKEIGQTLYDVDHVGRALEVIDEASRRHQPFDILHDHSGFALVPIADRIDVPVLHTLHGPFTPETRDFYRRHAEKVWVSALSRAQLESGPPDLRCVKVIPNPIDLRAWPLEPRKDGYLLWVGRMTAGKGPHRAIAAARLAGRPLVLAGPVQPGQRRFFERQVAPHIDGSAVRYVEEVGGAAKRALFAKASALLMPIRWPEPFGMVMIEAQACGTPVIAFPEGSAPEVVADGRSGFLVEDETAMASAVERLGELDPSRCRATVQARYDVDLVAASYDEAYREVMRADPPELEVARTA